MGPKANDMELRGSGYLTQPLSHWLVPPCSTGLGCGARSAMGRPCVEGFVLCVPRSRFQGLLSSKMTKTPVQLPGL